jgi:dephospho-CoA kinase
VVVIGLTGGIGSGKSTVSAMLAERGATIVDADLIARQVVEPGTPAHQAIVDRFGPGVVLGDGRLDRAALAAVVFRDPAARADLEAITHPAIQGEMARQTLEAPAGGVVVLDIPLLKAKRLPMAAVVVVDVPEDVAIERLVGQRGFDGADARRRVEAQISREQRRAIADIVIDNSGSRADLVAAVDRAWARVVALAGAGASALPDGA